MKQGSEHRIAIIPARGGSKRIPYKNIQDFDGVPMIAHTINAARQSGCFEHVLVSTDSEKIAEVARRFGAEVPFLRDHPTDDFEPVSRSVADSLIQAEAFYGKSWQSVASLMANCPLRAAPLIQEAVEHFEAGGASRQISGFAYHYANPFWALNVEDPSRPAFLFAGTVYEGLRSQDLPAVLCPTGAIWLSAAADLKRSRNFFHEPFTVYPIDWIAAADIDTPEDFEMALKLKKLQALDAHQSRKTLKTF